ncbi:hypothetical protein Vretimale_16068, partial [Volvox reticuliferus]
VVQETTSLASPRRVVVAVTSCAGRGAAVDGSLQGCPERLLPLPLPRPPPLASDGTTQNYQNASAIAVAAVAATEVATATATATATASGPRGPGRLSSFADSDGKYFKDRNDASPGVRQEQLQRLQSSQQPKCCVIC